MLSIPIDILQDVFLALNRNEVEKSQLICHRWNHTIKAFISHMPLRLLKQLKIIVRQNSDPYIEADGEIAFKTDKCETIRSRRDYIKFCVFGELTFDCYRNNEEIIFVSFNTRRNLKTEYL